MSSLLAELSTRARLLSPEERAQLAEGLLESLQEWASPEIEAAWDTEILKRIGEYERGEAVLSPATDVFAEARRLTQ
jgi:putative addiction module component (TIGR02574 family)